MPRLGRPRGFSRDAALRQAMEAFWTRGFDGASMADLQAAMGGIAAPSLYAAFGSKEQLFREAIDLYNKSFGTKLLGALQEASSAREGIAAMLVAALDVTCRPRGARGCFLVLAESYAASATPATKALLKQLHQARRDGLRARLERGVAEGDVPAAADIEMIAAFYSTMLDGVCHQARAGGKRVAIEAAIRGAMQAWRTFIGQPR